MDSFIQHINASLPDERGNDILFRFKRKTLNEMNERFAEVKTRGITNDEVFKDLIISEYSDLPQKYEKFYHEETVTKRTKRRLILNVVGSIIYILSLIVAFFGISFMTGKWDQTWVIIVSGILLWVSYILTLGVIKITSFRRIFHIFARILLAGDIVVASVAIFIFCLAILKVPHSWVIVIAGIAGMFIGDEIYATATKQKLAILNYLLYSPVIGTMAYIIFSGIGLLSWKTGWLIILLSLIADLFIVLIQMAKNKKYEQEVYESWSEN